jgi:glycine/D-amino acid oxidase-like deaminating enzyme
MESADVVIIGGGVTGLSSGFWLTRAGLDVVVVENGIVGWEASGRNGGLVSQKGDTPAEVGLAKETLVTKGTSSVPIEGLALGRFAGLEPSWRQGRRWDAGAYNT